MKMTVAAVLATLIMAHSAINTPRANREVIAKEKAISEKVVEKKQKKNINNRKTKKIAKSIHSSSNELIECTKNICYNDPDQIDTSSYTSTRATSML